MDNRHTKIGIIYTFSAYLLWGIITIYWKQIEYVPAGEILAHRIAWSAVFMLLLVIILGKWDDFIQECRGILKKKKQLFGITTAAIVITLNWFLFIWAVVHGHILQASLGYYINPLISILLGIIILKEPVTKSQLLSFILAAIGVLYLTFSYGVFPWISLLLATTFALYGLLKKTVDVSAIAGLTIETLLITPVALIYLWIIPNGSFTLTPFTTVTNLFLIGAGIVTAVPLLLFSSGAKQIPLAMVGFLQYITPTMMLVIGVFFYKEPFSQAHLVTFVFIWTALFLYMASIYKNSQRHLKAH
ncbi:EamA family transporter RarD [Oceanobacillus polygoni]|uniref:Chloramphenicol-sensitive protein RarD n=1 Tax=Oceanobacillus polygoni TaxID=1235259 RepID=A0A9X0YNY1_9BACI|nr:EamA family transporter RarD [Oceanobacillus polygoni]MBP2076290.1 chloramphenicol-sensitive protein RarD [Oceanobacillus polygoni]